MILIMHLGNILADEECFKYKWPFLFGDSGGGSTFTAILMDDGDIYVGGDSTASGVKYGTAPQTSFLNKYNSTNFIKWSKRIVD